MLVDRIFARMPPWKPRTLVHVGAHIGQEITRYEAMGPEQIVWIEADPETVPLLRETIQRKARTPACHHVINAVIADRDGATETFRHFTNKGASSSLYPSTATLRTHWQQIGLQESGRELSVSTATLDSILPAASIDPQQIDILVLDIQGAELRALAGAAGFIETVRLLEVEVSTEEIYAGAPLYPELHSHITALGFTQVTPTPWHGDVVYANDRYLRLRPRNSNAENG